jgi:two-component system chemotaxis response regulator CheY
VTEDNATPFSDFLDDYFAECDEHLMGVRRLLETAGYDVVEADDGMTALERYFLEKPDLVLLDLVMKGMMGLDVLEKLHEMDPKVRAIVVSADIQDSSRELAVAGGARNFLNKPVDRASVLLAVSGALEASA